MLGVSAIATTGIPLPFGDWAVEAWDEYRRQQSEAQLRQELERIVQDQAEWRRQIDAMLGSMAANQPREVRDLVERILGMVPGRIQKSMQRPDDPTGRTVSPTFRLREPADLAQFLPDRLPRFQKGDRPIPSSDLVLVELLGMGGFGEVWKAIHQDRPHALPVALKFCTDEKAASTLRREVELLDRVASRGRHSSIVELRYAHLQANPICLEYEYVDGGDLLALTSRLHATGRASPQLIAQILLQIARAVGFAHSQKPPIVHRDLKPANVLIQRRDDGKLLLKVADFGIGAVAAECERELAGDTPRASHASTDSQGYTPLYASPQQRRGTTKPDPRDDVYALGVLWYQLLIGDTFAEAPRGEGWKKRLLQQGVPTEQIHLLGRCIEDDPQDRPATAQEIADELARTRTDPASTPPEPRPAVPPLPEDRTSNPIPKRGGRQAIRPGVCLIVAGLLAAFVYTIIMLTEPQAWGKATAAIFVCTSLFVALAGFSLAQRRLYWLAISGSILAMFGLLLFTPIGLPLGVWSLIVLRNPRVRRAFRSLEE